MFAFIGGSGFYSMGEERSRKKVNTKYGDALIIHSKIAGKSFAFIPRHGESHSIPPHKINYKANISALSKEETSGVLSVLAVGAMEGFVPGDLVLIEDFISFWMQSTFYDSFKSGIKHTDFTEPFDEEIRNIIWETAKVKGIRLRDSGIVATTYGPRFETKAEVRALSGLGANLVSMTFGHEAPLLGEAEIPHACLGIVTNMACGLSGGHISEQEVIEITKKRKKDIMMILEGLLEKAR
jgi:5'-methylthioadenosine phosphorylase